jgi:hypothetical protein
MTALDTATSTSQGDQAASTPAADSSSAQANAAAAAPKAAAPAKQPAKSAQPAAAPAKTTDSKEAPAAESDDDLLAEPAGSYELKHADGTAFAPSEGFGKVASKHGVSSAAAQELFAELAPSIQEQYHAKLIETHRAQANAWAKETRGDAEFGGDKLAANIGLVKAALADAPKELVQSLQRSGYSNHLPTLKWLAEVGRMRSPDGKVVRGAPVMAGASESPVEGLTRIFAEKTKQE